MKADAQKVRSIFLAAVESHTPDQWGQYLDDACAGDVELRHRVEVLLRAHEQPNSWLDGPGLTATVDEPIREGPGSVIGPYRLLEQIGEGGFGVVFMAEQIQPVRRKVALKILKPGMDTRQVIARFEAERQALALMDHPSIAQVHDGGETSTGRPYFVMELVKGVPITDFCDQGRLTPRERLGLFVSVCQAVQHAHQKGIIHRDLKPSNVLVTLQDGAPLVKVIDFGIAKALDQQLTDKTLFTGFAQLLGTPLYMAPEQAALSNVDVDTRSDVYSLGVLLYELLTGTTPFDQERLRQASYDEIRRIIREQEPPRPSTRLSTLGQAASTACANRQSDPKRLSQALRGELDWVVMKALEKDRNRRYESASALAADVRRYLADEPVQACPPSLWYRLRKFVRRNRATLAPAALLLTLVVLGAAAAWWSEHEWSARRAETERAVTAALAQARTLLAEGDKQSGHPERWQATVRLAQSAVQQAAELLPTGGATGELAEEVDRVRSAVAAAVADSGVRVELDRIRLEQAAVKEGRFDLARANPRYAKMLRDYGVDPAAPAEAVARLRGSRVQEALLGALEDWLLFTSDPQERRQLEELLRAFEPDPDEFRTRWRAAVRQRDGPALARLAGEPAARRLPAGGVAKLAGDLERVNEVVTAERLLRAGQERFPGDFWLNQNLGSFLIKQGRAQVEEAVRYLTAALALRPDSPGVYLNLGTALRVKGDLEGALRCFQAALHIDPNYINAHFNRGVVLRLQGDLDGAIRCYRDALRIDPNYSNAHNNLGVALADKGDLEGAIRHHRDALRIDPEFAMAHTNLGRALKVKGDLDGAIRCYRDALCIEPNFAMAHTSLGLALCDKGDLEGAIRHYQDALRIDPEFALAHHNLGVALRAKGDLDGAIRCFRDALRLDPEFAAAHINLGNGLSSKKDQEGAIRCFQAAVRIEPNNALAHYNLGSALSRKGDLEGAIRYYQEALRIDPDYAEAHCNLGHALRNQGRFAEAVCALKAGHDLGSRRANWKYRSAAWVRQAESLVELDGKLDKVLKGEAQPAGAGERLAMARLCQHASKQLHAAAARFFAGAFTAEPKLADDPRVQDRYSAACAAALAGCGRGKDAGALGAAERARLRGQALLWLRAELAAWGRRSASGRPEDRAAVQHNLSHWQKDLDFAGVRGDALAKLPETEWLAWARLWADVEHALTKARATDSPREKPDKKP
jgi:tetratricopeptide (TPR) repeat protein